MSIVSNMTPLYQGAKERHLQLVEQVNDPSKAWTELFALDCLGVYAEGIEECLCCSPQDAPIVRVKSEPVDTDDQDGFEEYYYGLYEEEVA